MTTAVRPATVAEVAKIYQRRRSYVYRLASMHQWRRIRLHGLVYYDLNEVDVTLGNGELAQNGGQTV